MECLIPLSSGNGSALHEAWLSVRFFPGLYYVFFAVFSFLDKWGSISGDTITLRSRSPQESFVGSPSMNVPSADPETEV
jgi:hypothetical protein